MARNENEMGEREQVPSEPAATVRKSPGRPPGDPSRVVLVKPVLNAVRILQYLSISDEPVTLSELARALKINVSTCLGIVRTLLSVGLVASPGSTKTYAIGDGMMVLAEGVVARGGLQEILRPPMERLARRFGVTVSLWRRIDDDRLQLAISIVSETDVRIQMRVGQRLPCWVGAVGRVMAAHSGLPEAELRKRFKHLRWQSPPTFRRYMEQVKEAKARGYAIDDGEYAKGVFSIGVPVRDRAGAITMAVSATMFAGQHAPGTTRTITDDLLAIGRLLHARMS